MKAEAIAGALPDIEEAMKRYWVYCRENADARYAKGNGTIVQAKEKLVGVRVPLIREVAKPMRRAEPAVLKALVRELWPSRIFEDRLLAALLVQYLGDWEQAARLAPAADNWVLTDELCCHALGPMLLEEPKRFSQLRQWARSRNSWLRRCAAVSLIQWMRSERDKAPALAVLDMLMPDDARLVKRGTDWMLREWAKKDNAAAFAYMMKWAKKGNQHTKSVLTAASWKLSPQRRKQLRDAL